MESKNTVPRSASSNKPGLWSPPPETTFFSIPNNSVSKKAAVKLPQFTSTKGSFARFDMACTMCAMYPLPVPLSPVISAVVSSLEARSSIWRAISRIWGDDPSEERSTSGLVRASSIPTPRRIRTLSRTRSTASNKCGISTGFVRKFSAPSCIACTAICTSF